MLVKSLLWGGCKCWLSESLQYVFTYSLSRNYANFFIGLKIREICAFVCALIFVFCSWVIITKKFEKKWGFWVLIPYFVVIFLQLMNRYFVYVMLKSYYNSGRWLDKKLGRPLLLTCCFLQRCLSVIAISWFCLVLIIYASMTVSYQIIDQMWILKPVFVPNACFCRRNV